MCELYEVWAVKTKPRFYKASGFRAEGWVEEWVDRWAVCEVYEVWADR